MRVLFLASNPFLDGAAERLEQEVRAIRPRRARVKRVPYHAPFIHDLQHALMAHEPQIVHFTGPGPIYLGDGFGRPGVLEMKTLAKLFGLLNEWIRVVILNGCDELPALDPLSQVVDYTIAMTQPLSDPSAISFAEAFYGALGTGRTVQASFDAALKVLDAGTAPPVLRIRQGVDPSLPLIENPVRLRQAGAA